MMQFAPQTRQVRVGLLLPGAEMPYWMARMLAVLRRSADIELAVGVRCHVGATAQEQPSQDAHLLWRAWLRIDAQRNEDTAAWRSVDAADVLQGIPWIDVQTEVQQASLTLSAVDVAAIGAYRLDVLLQLSPASGMPALSGAVLQAAHCGVWSYGVGSPLGAGDAAQAALLDAVSGSAVTASWLRMERGQGSVVLDRAWVRNDPSSPMRTIERMAWTQAGFVPRRLRELAALGAGAFIDKHGARIAPLSGPTVPADQVAVMRAMGARLRGKLSQKLADALCYEQWTPYYRVDETGFPASTRGYIPLIPPSDRFWADPCAVHYRGQHAMFIEECEYDGGVGYLSVIPFDSRCRPQLPPKPILRQSGHLSYPFVFEDEGQLYMIPESAEARTISLYRCRRFPDDWEFVMHLAENLRAYDTTIWKHGGRYWMFATICEHEEAASWDELFLFHAPSLLTRDWVPHPCNPIVSDARRARPAGRIFQYGGNWYRPAQDCSRRYGGAVTLLRIDTIDPRHYAETPAARIEPNRAAGMFALHAYSRAGRLSCIDAVRRRSRLSLMRRLPLPIPWFGTRLPNHPTGGA